MELKIIKYDESLHRELVLPWYQAKGDGACIDWLPDGSTYIATADGLPVAIGCILMTNSKLCFMEHLATDPTARQMTQARALRFMALSLETIAKNLNYTVILGLVPEDHFSLAEFYKRQGAYFGTKLMRVTYKPL